MAYWYFCTIVSTHVLFSMKILSSSPYAAFNPKEWNSLSRISYSFSHTSIKVQKKYYGRLKKIKSNETIQKNNELPKQMQIVFA